jgi:hypothetical protein
VTKSCAQVPVVLESCCIAGVSTTAWASSKAIRIASLKPNFIAIPWLVGRFVPLAVKLGTERAFKCAGPCHSPTQNQDEAKICGRPLWKGTVIDPRGGKHSRCRQLEYSGLSPSSSVVCSDSGSYKPSYGGGLSLCL